MNTARLIALLVDLKRAGVTDLESHLQDHPDFLRLCMEAIVVTEVNAATVALMKAERHADIVGGDVSSFWGDRPDTFRRSICARFAGASHYDEETVLTALDGTPVEVAYSISYPAAFEERGMTVIATADIGERLRDAERLQQARSDLSHAARVSTLGELAASIAHEVNQPLAAISAYEAAVIAALAQARTADVAVRGAVEDRAVRFAATLPPADRAKLADAMAERAKKGRP